MENEFSFYAEEIEPLTFCDKNVGFELSKGLYQPPYKITPTAGGEHDFNTCSGCKSYHAKIVENANEFFGRFPNCCDKHKKLVELGGFDRNHYADTSTLVADKVIYTKQHFLNFLDKEDWYKEITDYITYCIFSFGTIPIEYGNVPYIHQYFFFTINYIKNSKVKKEFANRKLKILEFLENYGVGKNTDSISFNVLIKTYEKWYKIFPFELSFFHHLKERYNKIPIGFGKPELNKYLDMASIKPFTKQELINSLIKLTNTILTQINTKQLFEQGLITDSNKIKLELILRNRDIELKAGYVKNEISEEQVYRKMLKKWFKDEKKFIEEITPLLSVPPPQTTNTKTENAENNTNDFLVSTIEDFLTDFKDRINKNDYPILVEALKEYFTTGNFPKDCKQIKVTGKVNIKKFGWALNQLYRGEKTGILPIEYLQFAKDKISAFSNVSFNNTDHKKTTLYKYFTTKA
jgi:hypothetical protein